MAEIRYNSTVTVRCSPELVAAVDYAAQARGCKPAEWVRQALGTALALDGVTLAPVMPRDAASLYNVTADGQSRYALVNGDRIVSVSYSVEAPEGWLPVVHEDSEPFDAALHWRLAPHFTIGNDRVICTYPVVSKSTDFA